MLRTEQFKMMISPAEKLRIFRAAQSKGLSQADVMRLAFRDFERKIQQEAKAPTPHQEPEPAAA